MSLWVLTALAVLLLAWSLVAGRVERLDVTGPIVFVAAGIAAAAGPVDELHVSLETGIVHELAELTLVLVLFSDAVRVDPRDLRGHAGVPARLLLIALPLVVAAGAGLAAVMFTDLPWQLAALLAAILAPTDAALSAAVVADRSLPLGIRRSLNVESGLNDGLAAPLVTALIAAAGVAIGAGEFADSASGPGWDAVLGLAGGVAVGVATGHLGGRAVIAARDRGWTETGGERVATLMVALLPFTVARSVGANYFVAAFVAGLAYRGATRANRDHTVELPELLGQVLSLAVWFVVGATLVAGAVEVLDWRVVLYAACSLTVVRMAPVALALLGAGTDRATTVFLGWFGPRGLASVIFALLVAEELPTDDPGISTVVSVVVVTVLASVVLHGVSGRPLSARMAARAAEGEARPEHVIRTRHHYGLRRNTQPERPG